jgi:Coenzyme PQQ synthesis protein D (PqqD)/Transglutaminase-like superfamily
MPGSHRGAWHARDVVTSVDSSGGRVLLHLPSGTYLGLDRTAATIVDLLDADPEPEHAAEALVARFGIPHDQALADVEGVIDSVQRLSAPRTTRGRRPTVAGVSIVTRTWFRLPWRNRLTIARVTAVVIAVEVGLAVRPLPRLARLLGVPLETGRSDPPPTGSEDLGILTHEEQGVYWAVNWVLTRWLYDATCLRRALVLGWFLRRRRPVLRLGMIDEDAGVAHAWIEIAGHPFGATPVTGAFVTGIGTDRASATRRDDAADQMPGKRRELP